MSQRTALLVGTRKGLFVLDGDASRDAWQVRGPLCDGWPIHDAILDPGTGAILAGAQTATKGGWRPGQRVELPALSGVRAEMSSLLEPTGSAEDTFIFMPLADAQHAAAASRPSAAGAPTSGLRVP